MRSLTAALVATALGVALLAVPAQATPARPGEAHPDSGMSLTATVAPPPYVPVRAPGQPVPPIPDTLPLEIDPLAEYQGQRECSPAAKVGSQRLADLLRATYGAADIGIDRDCADGGQSEHKEGRALDWMLSYKTPAQREKVEAFLSWLLAPDGAGNPAAMARRLGVMYMGWHDRIWRSYQADSGWGELKGCFSKPDPSDDTYCHRDHLHISLSWDGSAGRTSYWDGTPELLGACPEPTGATALGSPLADAVTDVAPWRVLDTRAGRGTGVSCRMESDRWDGDGRAVKVRVTGRNGVPVAGVAAVRVRVGVSGVNAPTKVIASATGSVASRTWTVGAVTFGNAITLSQNRSASADLLVPVSTEGTITFTDLYGAVDAKAWVTGWVAVGPPPSVIAPFPGPTLTFGSKGAAVTSVQLALIKRGYRIASLAVASPSYGTYTTDTSLAVRRYQAKHPSLGAVTGRVTRAWYRSITAVLATPTPPPPVVVSLSAVVAHEAAATRIVQAALNTVMTAGLTVDGQWGPLTQTAYQQFRVTLGGVPAALPDDAPDLVSLTELGRRAGFTVTS